MKRLLTVGIAALAGALAGSAVRQLVLRKTTSSGGEIVIAARPIPIAAGVTAGLFLPRYRPLVAFVVAVNVAANTRTGGESATPDTAQG